MKRILTALVALPILLYTVWSPNPYLFAALAAVAVMIALVEFYNLALTPVTLSQTIPGCGAGLVILASFALGRPGLSRATVVALVMISLVIAVLQPAQIKTALTSVCAIVFGVLYVALLASCLVGVRFIPDSAFGYTAPHLSSKLLTMFFAIVMMTDTGAYYVGRTIGRHKLAPLISPGKTIEGAIGGFGMAVAAGYLCKLIFFPEIPLAHALILGGAMGVIGQIGDLAESMLKRAANVKDSGKLLPGHGGMLDRIDSILFCAPVLYFYTRLFVSGP